jgi:hypothetical protein
MNLQRSEKDIQAGIVSVLKAHGILAFRMNTGAMRGNHKGKPWYVRFGFPGTADILAFPQIETRIRLAPGSNPATVWIRLTTILWIECKRPGEKQEPDQEHFQLIVEQAGHTYLVGHSPQEVLDWIEARRKAAKGESCPR